MEKLILLLGLLIFPIVTCQGQSVAKPMDIPTVELLIHFHKRKYDKLDERTKNEVKHSAITKTASNVYEKYEQLNKELSARYSIISAWGSTALSALQLANEIKATYPLISTFIRQTRELKNIYVINEYAKAIEGIQIECQYLSATIKKIPLLKADAAAIAEVILELQTRVTSINQILRNCTFMVQGYIALQGIKYQDNIIDKAKIANKIIAEYSK
ncbi:unknown [Porphyromonas sp. CAG:1061]|uniref:hypothetical protein n=1 Tax=Porphyromonas sp. CAG:1061 TaxID=1262916 RepID=UPI000339BA3E|nr:hypothetical protein [Porphyromonas sp. CAG:1061]CCY08630.1 unknown [Porphyromonas sp. CAG:1061]